MIEVTQWRGDCAEASVGASVAIARVGEAVGVTGGDRVTTFRSAAKPFQLAVSLEALGDPALDDEDLALGASSHSAEPAHVARVLAILSRFGVAQEWLRCGAHPPMHTPSAEAVLRGGGAFTALHNNCSGKHAFMLAACVKRGWDLDYLSPDHPYQRRAFDEMSRWMGVRPFVAVDGCGVPTFCQPLSGVATAWLALASAMARGDGRLARVGWAMARHPELTSGTGRLDLEVVRGAREPMAAKVGAAGLFCIALPRRELALAVKVHGGVMEALPALVAWALAEAAPGAWEEPDGWELRRVRNVAGREVGGWTVSLA